jgi:hypothetical protein
MGGAPGTGLTLAAIRDIVRDQIGEPATAVQAAADELVDTTLRWWPERHMAALARRQADAGPEALDAIAVISSKVREDVEHRWKMSANTVSALDLLCLAVVTEIANLWFSSPEARIDMRAIMFTIRRWRYIMPPADRMRATSSSSSKNVAIDMGWSSLTRGVSRCQVTTHLSAVVR